ncbi:uncharacterized protein LAJ45_01132 [Morchella importuna]|uniref:uncharacterized protein n=1 Tax=Morchella importuna TaxID=1174673 RepID=UPI001E8CF257|nr:uncharacterized protein LAJ45_01132 [Morchella importuna]KAH8154604.1 hypothetical protein LAJ45_01132 [Morchella importuna]
MERVTYEDRLKSTGAGNPVPSLLKEEKVESYSIVESSASLMDIDTPTGLKTRNDTPAYAVVGPTALSPTGAFGFTDYTPVRTRDGVRVVRNSGAPNMSAATVTIPFIPRSRHPMSDAPQPLDQLQPPNPNITAATRSLLELFSTDERHFQTAVIAGTGQSVTAEAARVREMLLSARSKSAAMRCECFECGGALLLEGPCFWKLDSL